MQIAAAVLFATLAAIPATVERMELDVVVDHQRHRIEGTSRLTVRNVSSSPVEAVPFLLNRLMTVKHAGGRSFQQDVTIFGDDPMRQVNAVTVTLARPLAPGATTMIDLTYGGPITGYTETGSRYIRDTVDEAYTLIREDAYSFPTIGVPSVKTLRGTKRRDFTFDVSIDVPRGFVVATGGKPGETTERDGRVTYRFSSKIPVPWLNIAIAKFKLLEDSGVRLYYLPEDEAGAKLVLEKTKRALALYTAWFGPLAEPPQFTIVEIPEGWGSQAHLVAGIIQSAAAFKDPSLLGELYHELGHFWNVPDRDVPSPRWNEGLSTWLQRVVAEEIDGAAKLTWAARSSRWKTRVAENPRLREVPLENYGRESMTDWSYGVGALYFAMLESTIGREAVLSVLREYFQQNKIEGGTLRELTEMFERRFPSTREINQTWIATTEWTKKLEEIR